MALSPRGEFWQNYWSHHRLCYPEDVKEGWADSNVRHTTADDSLCLSLYLAKDAGAVGIFMVATHLEDPERLEMVAPYLRRLPEVLDDTTQSDKGGTHLSIDVSGPRELGCREGVASSPEDHLPVGDQGSDGQIAKRLGRGGPHIWRSRSRRRTGYFWQPAARRGPKTRRPAIPHFWGRFRALSCSATSVSSSTAFMSLTACF